MDTIIYVYPLREVNRDRQELLNKSGQQSGGQECLDKGEQNSRQVRQSDKRGRLEEKEHQRKELCKESASSDCEMEAAADLFCMEELDMPGYHLVRVGISNKLAEMCGGNQRQGNTVSGKCEGIFRAGYHASVQNEEAFAQRKECLERTCFPKSTFMHKARREGFWRRRRRQKKQQAEQQWERALLEDFLHQILKDPEQSFVVCEEALPFFNRWEFNGYFETDWVKHMLRYAKEEPQAFVFPHFLVLGQARCLAEILYTCAGKMKSLKWILPARQFREELQELVEDIYDEYGLAVDVHLLEDEDAYRKTRISCALPTVVLDFSEADRVPTADIAKGSLWLDMASSEEKRRRIEERNTGIHYFSLKKEWKQPQKALFHLDTNSKNGYNT